MRSLENSPIERVTARYELARDAWVPEAWIIEKSDNGKK